MNTVGMCHQVAVFSLALFLSVGRAEAFGAEPVPPRIQFEVTKKDSRGRVQVMEARTDRGGCIAEIVYEGLPQIYVVVISRTRLQNLGHLLIRDGTEDNLTNEVLMENFHKAIGEHCLPLIVPGYDRV